MEKIEVFGLLVVGKIVVFIGLLECMMWDEVKVMVEWFGVKVFGFVLKKMDFVIVGFGVGFKFKKVIEFDIEVIFEDGWFELVGV